MQTKSTYRLAPGTTVVVADEDGSRSRHTVEPFEEIDMVITSVVGPHSTMNGGGFDHYGHCPITGLSMLVRTTFKPPAHTTFIPVAS